MRPPSTPPKSASARGTSADWAARPSTGYSSSRAQGLSTVPEVERSTSRGSINFSYPMNALPNSPSPPPPSANREVTTPPPLAHEKHSPESVVFRRSVSLSGRKPSKRKSIGFGTGEKTLGTAVAAAQAASLQKDDATPNHSRTGALRASDIDHQAPGPLPTQLDHRHTPRHPVSMVREPDKGEGSANVEMPAESIDQTRADNRLSSYDSAKFMEHTKNIHSLVPSEQLPTVTVAQTSAEPSTRQNHFDSRVPPELEHENQTPHFRQSASPPRSTRFSSHLSILGTGEQLHQPPPRSVSPVKPALKHHPKGSLSPDGRTAVVGRPSQAFSEISDGTSVASDDGSRVGFRRKPAKVSFDDDAEIVGVAASPPTSPRHALPESPQGKSKFKSNWFGGNKKKSAPLESFGDGDFDDVLKPRPDLPSFGSIRGTREAEPQESVREALSDDESTASSGSGEIVTGVSFSSDHALGGLLKETRPGPVHEPAKFDYQSAPASSNVDGQRSAIDLKESVSACGVNEPSSDTGHEGVHAFKPKKQESTPQEEPESSALAITSPSNSPVIENQRASLELIRVPGGFPRTSLELDRKTSGKRKSRRKSDEASGSNATVFDESGNPTSDGHVTDEESSESVYSDAPEDFDGDGFGSINAIMSAESSKPNGSTGATIQSSVFSEVTHVARAMTPEPDRAIQQSSDSPDSPGNPSSSSAYPPRPNAKSTKRPLSVDASKIRQAPKGGTNGIPPEKTGRGAIDSRQRLSQMPSKRPASMDPGLTRNKDTYNGGELRWAQAASPLNNSRPMSNGSDSSSSFKRSGHSSKAGSQYSMRRTLRGNPRVESPAGNSNSPGRRRPLSSGSATGKMRTTLRTGNQGDRSSFFSTGKASMVKAPKSGALLKSRFNDSDDEDAGGSAIVFQSRFDDSSDDRSPFGNSLRPVRGIPRRQGRHDGDSTELEDSSEDERRPPSRPTTAQRPVPSIDTSGLAAVARSRGTTREALEDFLYQPKPSLFSRLSMKKTREPDTRIRKLSLGGAGRGEQPPGTSSLERNPVQDHPVPNGYGRQNITTVTANNPETPQRLSKRGFKRYTMTENWSLNLGSKETGSPEPTADPNNSARSAVYQNQQTRPTRKVSQKRNTDSTLENPRASRPQVDDDVFDLPERSTSALDVVIAPAGRKRRFPALRKALGLRS